ncbi:D-2-hydroxyacid dehydrogenase family protein [Streptomyces sp. SID3343]|uniref:D-2-hydroxyacid dehydrogenase family protein n=1 Tax=Streptomyces sp. SID3343 TaxID=2690260 RepID=UPI00136A4414|nr:D-2-hydroxyacid dehydrogenase family protein [Streptomyces sp. SID3343]MYW03613.1 D-2-hydroxyacid dehydrogenase family protein [Streptomyces sp. SID3343]
MREVVTILDDYQGVALSSADWTAVHAVFDVEVIGEHIADPDELVTRLRGSSVVVAMRERTPFPASVLSRLPALRLLVTTGMRNASVDLAAAREHGVLVCGTAGGGNDVPELTFGMMVALTRDFAGADRDVRDGRWQRGIGPRLAGHTLGVVGLGRLGGPVARLAQAFGMNVIAWSPHLTRERAAEWGATAVTKEALFAESDVVTIHLPLAPGTRGIVGEKELRGMRPTAFLINTSRGPIVDEAALVSVLADRAIAGAGLDVYDTEPLPGDHPLTRLPNTLLLPHIGYVTTDAYAVFFRDVVEDVLAFAAGRPVRVLDIE